MAPRTLLRVSGELNEKDDFYQDQLLGNEIIGIRMGKKVNSLIKLCLIDIVKQR